MYLSDASESALEAGIEIVALDHKNIEFLKEGEVLSF